MKKTENDDQVTIHHASSLMVGPYSTINVTYSYMIVDFLRQYLQR
jgi:hypothetical protein